MIKKYKHMREDFSESDFTPDEQEIINSQDDIPDGFFDDALDIEDDDIWDDDTYVGDDDDIHLNNIADSDDDMPEDFFDDFDGFDEDDVIDVEDPEYWENSKEIDPKDFDLEDNPDAGAKWIGLAASEDFDDDTFTSEEHSEAFHNAARKAMDPAHSDDFRRIISLEDMEESKRKVRKNRLKENIEDWDDDDVMTYDGDEMEDWDWEAYNDRYGGASPHQEMSDHLADCFPTRDSEYQNDEGKYDPFTYTQMGDGEGGLGKRTKSAAYAYELSGGDYAPTFDDGTVLGGNFDNDEADKSDEEFAMSDNADLDAWVRESKKVKKNRLKEDSAFFCSNKPKDENRDLPEWVYQKFGKIYESCRK